MAVWRRQWMVGLGVCATLMASCAAKKEEPSKAMKQAFQAWDAGNAVTEGLEKQMKPVGETTSTTPRRATLEPGEPLWIQSGKSRIVQLARPVKRVSVADPELAGIVVYGPRTIQVNAKQIPSPAGPPVPPVSLSVNRTGLVTGQTLTPEPRLAETTLILWDGSDVPDVHTLTVADFLAEQVVLEVTVAELNRTEMEEHG